MNEGITEKEVGAGDELVNALFDFYKIPRNKPTELANLFGEGRQQVQNMRNRKERNFTYKIMMNLLERANAANQKQAQTD